MINILCVIPSRLNSTRLPRKPLLPILGKPMIQWTYERARASDCLTKLIVATDSLEIAEVIHQIGGEVAMTDPNIPTGSERVAAVAEQHPDMDVVINLQGDEPFVTPGMLKALVAPYLNQEQPEMTTLAHPLSPENYTSPGCVKVITDLYHQALYFSRAPIPHYRTQQSTPLAYHHVGMYAFRRDFLMHYRTLPQTPLEKAESLEQLRVLEHGYKIRLCLTEETSFEINTPEEYALAEDFARKQLASYATTASS